MWVLLLISVDRYLFLFEITDGDYIYVARLLQRGSTVAFDLLQSFAGYFLLEQLIITQAGKFTTCAQAFLGSFSPH